MDYFKYSVVVLLVLASEFTFSTWSAEICCSGVGCFNNNPPFGGIPLPQCPDTLQISMRVYTRGNPTAGQVVTRTTIPPAYDGFKMTAFLVHGWLGGKDNNWLHNIKDAMLAVADWNVIVVGWDMGSRQIWYPQSASDTRAVGAEIALVADNLIRSGDSANSRLYCVGHSLGGHVCGHAGARTKFGRITGLDPAGPLFENRESTAGLNPNCANLVDVLHTNGEPGIVLNLGTMKVLGHADFYPNGGGRQPGCILDPFKVSKTTDQFVDLMPSCSHFRAVFYYLESIRTPCFLSRFTCTDQYNLPASCTFSVNPVQSMGFAANTYAARGIFYLETTDDSPYCKN